MKTYKEQRGIAMGAARSQLRKMGFSDSSMTITHVMFVLDDIHRENPNLVAGQWWSNASPNQFRLFKKEWKEWKKGIQREFSFITPGM